MPASDHVVRNGINVMIDKLKDIESLLCSPDCSIRQALARITDAGVLAQMVVDGAGALIGTVTDADVRRALLRGANVDDPVTECVHMDPIVGQVGQDAANAALLHGIPGLVTFLPVLDTERRVIEVWLKQQSFDRMPALVMAGGKGSRLGEITRNTPKPLLKVAGVPIIEHILNRLEVGGVRQVFVSVHHLSGQIAEFVQARTGVAKIDLIEETEPLGTAGAIACVPVGTVEGLIVANGDLVTKTDFHALESFHLRQGNDVTIAAASFEVPVPYGVIHHSAEGIFQRLEEKPTMTYTVSAGIYALSSAAIALVPPNRRSDMPDLINRARAIGLRIGVFPIHEYWRDVGRPGDLDAARREHSADVVLIEDSRVSEEHQQ